MIETAIALCNNNSYQFYYVLSLHAFKIKLQDII